MMKIIQVRKNDGDKFFTYGIFFPYLVKHKFSFSFVSSFQDQSIKLNTAIPNKTQCAFECLKKA
jgi:hypothetical protein